ncbi:MAG TPA: T9SS type A sorting domain-containing protein, partial [Saprospiraceae bacterium]|nr:T9SS type A sorting domain-containing protein [Saprospiraceae bacterium]
ESSYVFIPTNDVESFNAYQEAVFDKISFYPNPVLNNGRLIFLTDNQTEINLSLMDIDGNIIYHDLVNTMKGRNEIKLDVTTIKSGIYIIRVQNEIESYFTKLIIQH